MTKQAKPPIVVDAVGYASFTQSVADHLGHFKIPCVLKRAHAMVQHVGKDFSLLLREGLGSLGIRWFPKIRFYEGKSRRVNWDQRSFVEI